MARINEMEMIQRIMKGLNCSEAEAREIYAADKEVDRMEDKHVNDDLDIDKKKASRKYARADKKPTAYKFAKKTHKSNATKGAIIAALVAWLSEETDFEVTDINVINAERQIKFSSAGNTFDLTLIQNRKPKT